MTNDFYIIADDATGANDAGVQFARRGYPATVYFLPGNVTGIASKSGITVIDTDSRGVSADEAYRRVQAVVRGLTVPSNRLFKKVDSTLRGNIGYEVRAILEQRPGSIAFVVPAYPANGRTTIGGIQYLYGKPVHETEIGRDPKTPVVSSRVADILEAPCSVIGTDIMEKGIPVCINQIQSTCEKGIRCFVFDAETNDHLEWIASLYNEFPNAVWVGCAGIAGYLCPDVEKTGRMPLPDPGGKPMLFITGSLSASTYEQVLAFEGPNIHKALLNPLTVLADSELGAIVDEAEIQYKKRKHVVISLQADNEARVAAREYARKENISVTDIGNRLRFAMGGIARELVNTLNPPVLFVSGGDTARSVFEKLGITGINIVDELEPGIPIGKATERELYLITKAGAFGNQNSFNHIIHTLYKESQV